MGFYTLTSKNKVHHIDIGSREPMDDTMRKTADYVVQNKKASKLIDKNESDMKKKRDIRSMNDIKFGNNPNKAKD